MTNDHSVLIKRPDDLDTNALCRIMNEMELSTVERRVCERYSPCHDVLGLQRIRDEGRRVRGRLKVEKHR